jgi:D-alanine-D-alanine ligase
VKDSILLFGGSSEERLVSVASAQNLTKNYEFSECWFIHQDGRLTRVTRDELLAHQRAFEVPFKPRESAFCNSIRQALPALKGKVVFLALHGTEGEDGKLQASLETEKIAFTGSGSESSRNCFDKLKAKRIVLENQIRTAPQIQIKKDHGPKMTAELSAFAQQHKKIVIKPVESGSSIGLHIVETQPQLEKAVADILKSPYSIYMAEKFISGRELTVGVLQAQDLGAPPVALPASEVVLSAGRNFDYKGKYLGEGTTEITPAELTPQELSLAQALAIAAHKALGCYGYSRTDMILTPDGNPVFLETNTLPGLSKASFVPQQLAVIHVPIQSFVADQLDLAKRRYKAL